MNIASGAIGMLEALERDRRPGEFVVPITDAEVAYLEPIVPALRLAALMDLRPLDREGDPDPSTYRGRLGYGSPALIQRKRRVRRY